MRRITYIIALLVFLPILVSGQGNCNNLDFENGTFQGWTGIYGCNDGRFEDYEIHLNTSCEDFGSTLDPLSNQINNNESQQSIISATFNDGSDPYVNVLKLKSPLGGNYVARIADLYANSRAGALSKKIQVDADNSLLTLYYAIVLEAPGHSPVTENPYFRIVLKDPNGNSVPCVEYTQDGSSDAVGFQPYKCTAGGFSCRSDRGPEGILTEIVYRDWTAISINLQDYIGKEVELEVSAGGCSLSGHLGYAYFDAKCGKPEIIKSQDIVCKGNPATLTAPLGMDLYQWRLGSANGPIVFTGNPFLADVGGTYYCTMTPFSTANAKCPFTLNTTVTASNKLPSAAFDILADTICAGTTVNIESKSTIIGGGSIDKFLWNISNGANGNGTTFTYTFATAGNYSIKHLVESVEGCIDTLSKDIEIFETFKPKIDPVSVYCNDDPPFNIVATPTGGIWTNASNPTGIFNPNAYANDTTVTVSYTIGACHNTISTPVQIRARKVAFFTVPQPMCSNAPAVFLKGTNPGGSWVGINIDKTGRFVPAIAGPGWHTVTYVFGNPCGDTYTDSILVYPSKDATLPDYNPVCILDAPITIPVKDEGGTWSGATTNNIFDPSIGVGTYPLIYSFTGNCPTTDTTYITVVEKSDAEFDLPKEVCETDERFTITVNQKGGTLSGNGIVSVQQGIFDPKIAGIGTHTIQYLIPGACGDTVSKPIIVVAKPLVDFTVPNTFCIEDDDYQIQPLQTGGTWSGAVNTTGVFSPSTVGPGTYTITYSFGGACASQSQQTVTVVDKPDPFFTLPDTLCSSDNSINISPNSNGGEWSGNVSNGVFSPNTSEGYHIISYQFAGTCKAAHSDSVYVKRNVNIAINGKSQYCKIENTAKFTVSPKGGVFEGSFIDQNGVVDFTSLTAGSYTFTYSIAGKCGDKKEFTFSLIETPNADFTLTDTLCLGENTLANPLQSGGTWSGTGINNTGEFSSIGLVANTSYSVTYSFDGACPANASKSIYVQAYEDASFTGPLSACIKEPSFTLSPLKSGGIWGGIANGQGIVNPSFYAPDSIYLVSYSLGGNCPDADSMYISIRDFYRSNFDAPSIVCRNAEVLTLQGEDKGGGWFGDGITSAIKGTFDPSKVVGDTAIIRYVFNGVCGSSHTDTILLKDAVTPTIVPIGTFCWYTDSLIKPIVQPTGGVFVFQNDSSASLNLNPSTLTPGIHPVQYGITGDCPSFVSTNIEIAEPIRISSIDTKPISCEGNCDAKITVATTYNSTNGLSYLIFNTTDTLNIGKTAKDLCPDNYFIEIQDVFGCKIDTITTISPQLPGEIFLSASPNICNNTNGYITLDSTLNVDNNGFLRWNGTTYKDSIGGLKEGLYPIEYISSNGCTVLDTIEITKIDAPSLATVYIAPTCFENNDAFAYIENIDNGTPPYQYLWSTGETNDSIINLPAGPYGLTVTDANGCTVSSNINIQKPEKLVLELNTPDTLVCIGDSVFVAPSITTGDILSTLFVEGKDIFRTNFYAQKGVYSISARSTDKCRTDTILLIIDNAPALDFELNSIATTLCEGSLFEASVTILQSAGGITYNWLNNTANSQNFTKKVTANDNGSYIIVAVSDKCMEKMDSVEINVNSAPVLALNDYPNMGCEPLEISLFDSAYPTAEFYINGEFIAQHQPKLLSAGDYTLQVIASNSNCTTDSLLTNVISVYPLPQVRIISTPLQITTLQPLAQFTDASTPLLFSKNWSITKSIDTLFSSTASSPSFSFPEISDTYKIELVGETDKGCTGFTTMYIKVEDEFHVFVPNSFTPNGDGDNDVFSIQTLNIDVASFTLQIFDRWGQVVFQTENEDEMWNGLFQNNGAEVPIGVYNWKLNIVDNDGRYIPKIGHINVIR